MHVAQSFGPMMYMYVGRSWPFLLLGVDDDHLTDNDIDLLQYFISAIIRQRQLPSI